VENWWDFNFIYSLSNWQQKANEELTSSSLDAFTTEIWKQELLNQNKNFFFLTSAFRVSYFKIFYVQEEMKEKLWSDYLIIWTF
jgi:hypothetical protein